METVETLDRSAPLILSLVLLLQLIATSFEILKKRSSSSDEIQLRQQIKQLLKEASSLSTPSTFAQAAKLRRAAAAKEKELTKCRECLNEKKSSYDLYLRVLSVVKVLAYLVLSWSFWGIPVAAIPHQLVQPFGKMLSWGARDPASSHIMVGIVPWLVLTTRVSKHLCLKLANRLSCL
ncbi:hypothetical protein QJS10_CPA03g02424 [Acorus calamus]|uniref:Tail-anchored protein insertion receptor WRB n=1 Tax=Acorus calamus TaxID=4465 RepID=A0AAV9F2P6_ACOCL|nr:hypothetical protein QJS10_CPA03g02424 [Acorus calamus]